MGGLTSIVDAKQVDARMVLLLGMLLVALFAQSVLATSSVDDRLFRDADKGDLSAVEWDIARGTDVNAHVDFGQTALYVASMRGHLSLVKWLLDHGAKVNAKDNDGETPLEITAAFGQPDMLQLLVSHGANVNARDEWGHTPLYLAAK
jgi:ankyrin repeat protein